MIGWIPALLGDTSLTLFLAGCVLGYTRTVPALAAFGVASLGMVLGIIATIGGVIMLVRTGMSLQSGMALFGLVPALVLVYSLINARGLPAINDISTDLVYPPALRHAAALPQNAKRDMSLPESFKAPIQKHYGDLQSLGLRQQRDDVFVKALELARRQPGWTVTASTVTDTESIIEGEAQTQLFGFVDDWVIRITDAQGGGVVVDMRSKSRDGKGDLGTNAQRIREFFAQLQS